MAALLEVLACTDALDRPTEAAREMQEAEAAQDFDRACLLACRQFTQTAAKVRRECERTGVVHDAAFWQQCADEAKQARRLYEAYQDAPLSCLLAALREARLFLYADALIGRIRWAELVY